MGRGEDRISILPNEILQVILCLMPLKYAIRTSTLSKRWRHLWQINLISSTSLQFGEDFSCNQSPKQFVMTLDRYLQLHGNRNLDKFEILFSPFDIFFANLKNWVATVLAKGIKQLEINLSQGALKLNYFTETYVDDRMPFVMPNSIFNSSSLTQLSLSRCNFSEPLDLTNFVGLCSLDLTNLTDEMLTRILENCVSLEIICLKRCENLEEVKFVGNKLKLQKLVIVDCIGVSGIEISAPKLESFLYHGWIMFSLYFDNDVTKVNDAYLCSGELYDYEQGFFNILSDFSHVKVLTICSMGLMNVVAEALEYDEEDYIPLELHNLQELQIVLNSIWEEPIHCIFSFFRLCPSPFLEKLFIQLPNNFYQQNDQRSLVDTEKKAPDIVFQNLKWIKITNFRGTPLELKLVRFLLEKAILLESIIFVFMNQCDISNNSLSVRIIKGQLSVIPKASKDANIVICGPLDHDCVINPTHTTFYHQEKYRNGTTVHLDNGSTRSEDIPLDQEFL